jgi:hypothetical protein
MGQIHPAQEHTCLSPRTSLPASSAHGHCLACPTVSASLLARVSSVPDKPATLRVSCLTLSPPWLSVWWGHLDSSIVLLNRPRFLLRAADSMRTEARGDRAGQSSVPQPDLHHSPPSVIFVERPIRPCQRLSSRKASKSAEGTWRAVRSAVGAYPPNHWWHAIEIRSREHRHILEKLDTHHHPPTTVASRKDGRSAATAIPRSRRH